MEGTWKPSSIQAIFVTEITIYQYELLSVSLTGRQLLLHLDDKPDRLNLENVHKALKCPCLETDHNVARALKDPTHRLAPAGPGGKYKWVLACIEL